MAKKAQPPHADAWYKTAAGDMFEVVAVDDDAIEIQHLDGTVEALDHDDWYGLLPREIAPPHEDLLDEDDQGQRPRHHASERARRPFDDWSEPLDDED